MEGLPETIPLECVRIDTDAGFARVAAHAGSLASSESCVVMTLNCGSRNRIARIGETVLH